MVVNLSRSLLVAFVLMVVGACSPESASTTSGTVSLTTFGASTTAAVAPTTQEPRTSTTVQVPTTPPIALPVVPNVSTGWSVLAGDLLVANGSGVHVVRGGVTVANPVTSPVESAFADGSGGIIFLTPDLNRYPRYWPDPYSGGGRIVWRASPDGTADALYTSDAPEGSTWETLNLYAVDVVPSVSGLPSAILTRREAVSSDTLFDRVMVLPLDGMATPTLIPAETPGEGGVTGLGWQQLENRLLMSTASDGGAWLSAWSVAGEALAWPTNPVTEETPCPVDPTIGNCLRSTALRSMATIVGTTLIAYAEADDLGEGWTDLVIFDTASGTEVSRVQVAEPGSNTYPKLLHATDEAIAISLIRVDMGKWIHLPILVYDLATGTLTESALEGVGTLVA